MAIFRRFDTAAALTYAQQDWTEVEFVSTFFVPGLVVFTNADGTETHFAGNDLAFDGTVFSGHITAGSRTSGGGGTVYEQVTDFSVPAEILNKPRYASFIFDEVLKGDDTLFGSAANDILRGRGGTDTLYGGGGNDTLDGGNGTYGLVFGGDGDDRLSGGDGADVLNGGPGNDFLNGGLGVNQLFGGDGDDTFQGGGGTDYFDGGQGFDIIKVPDTNGFPTGSTSPNVIRIDGGASEGIGAGDQYVSIEGIIGSDTTDVLIGNDVDNYITGGIKGNDQIHGLGGNDRLIGATFGNSSFWGGVGADYIQGAIAQFGFGYDYARYDFANAGVAVNLATGIGSAGEADGDYLVQIDGLVGSQFGDFLAGSSGANFIYGQGGADVIFGAGGSDNLYGGAGSDTFAFRPFDLQAGVYSVIKDFGEGAGDQDVLGLMYFHEADVQFTNTQGGVFVTTTQLNGNGGIFIENFTTAQLADQVYFVT